MIMANDPKPGESFEDWCDRLATLNAERAEAAEKGWQKELHEKLAEQARSRSDTARLAYDIALAEAGR